MNDTTEKLSVSLGLGLLSIGRVWGYRQGLPPAEEDARALLHHAVLKGITFFDTAPAYGSSERIFGRFLKGLGARASDAKVDATFARKDAAFQDLTGLGLHPNSGPML